MLCEKIIGEGCEGGGGEWKEGRDKNLYKGVSKDTILLLNMNLNVIY